MCAVCGVYPAALSEELPLEAKQLKSVQLLALRLPWSVQSHGCDKVVTVGLLSLHVCGFKSNIGACGEDTRQGCAQRWQLCVCVCVCIS